MICTQHEIFCGNIKSRRRWLRREQKLRFVCNPANWTKRDGCGADDGLRYIRNRDVTWVIGDRTEFILHLVIIFHIVGRGK